MLLLPDPPVFPPDSTCTCIYTSAVLLWSCKLWPRVWPYKVETCCVTSHYKSSKTCPRQKVPHLPSCQFCTHMRTHTQRCLQTHARQSAYFWRMFVYSSSTHLVFVMVPCLCWCLYFLSGWLSERFEVFCFCFPCMDLAYRIYICTRAVHILLLLLLSTVCVTTSTYHIISTVYMCLPIAVIVLLWGLVWVGTLIFCGHPAPKRHDIGTSVIFCGDLDVTSGVM